MLVNPLRGEVALRADGTVHVLRLSLGSLAALEAAMQADSLADLAERIERGGLRSRDVIQVLAAGFRGAGRVVDEAEVAEMAIEGGAPAAVRAAVALIAAAFGADAA